MSEKDEKVCGDFGGRNQNGAPCQRKPGWGRGASITQGQCRFHFEQGDTKSEMKKRLNVIKGNFSGEDDLWMPDYFEEPHRKRYRHYVEQLKEKGIYDPIDQTMIQFLVLMECFAHEAASEMIRDAIVTEDQAHGGRKRKHPAWKIITQAINRYESLGDEFGIGAATRATMELIEESKDVDPMEEIVNR